MLCVAVFMVLTAGISAAETDNKSSVGLLLGDPVALSLTLPVSSDTFLDIHAGIWAWSFWHDLLYDTPFLSVDYAWNRPFKGLPFFSYVGAGIAVFFRDNPKDDNNSDACAAVRIPFGFEFFADNNISVGFEIAPIYQFLPAYNAKPYGLELNGGLFMRYSY